MSSAVGLISNPNSGHNRDRFDRIRERVSHCSPVHHLVTDTADQVPEALSRLAELDIATLAINGGDGTASAILGQLLENRPFSRLPRIVLLPGGTANMNAGDVGASGRLEAAVARFCQWCEGPQHTAGLVASRPLLRVQLHNSDQLHHGMFLGAGAVTQGTEYAHREIHSRGLRDDFSLALGTARTLWGVLRDDPEFNQHVTIDLSLDGGPPRRHDSLVLVISSLQRLAFGMRPFWGTGPGHLRLTVMEQHCTKFLRTFVSIARGRPNRNAVPQSGYFSHNAERIELSMNGSLNLDGEIIHAVGKVVVSATPCLEFIKL
ncbi:MAG: diacylglycerol kinase family protein [Gammaproteobacteria bacterium]|nr:diacylglycerol kinase family protein [Gammaproteobacteria bacterium]